MTTVTCYECKKKYDYEEDGFCPRCGAFNQRSRGSYTVAKNGDIVRVDGINEAGHKNSFVHAEYHAEERDRKKTGLDRRHPAPGEKVKGASAAKAERSARRTRAGTKKQNPAGVGFMIIWLMVLLLSILFEVLQS